MIEEAEEGLAQNLARDPFARLREMTSARIGLGRSGDAIPTGGVLAFGAAHALARDAVHSAMDEAALAAALSPRPVLRVHSAAPDRNIYLRRPDLGRTLDPVSRAALEAFNGTGFELLFVIGDGLSARAVNAHAVPFLEEFLNEFPMPGTVPIVLATQARVALADEIGEALNARMVVMLIGERPGLSVADSLGIYITYAPRRGRRDSERNCISNVHMNGGLTYKTAAVSLAVLIRKALTQQETGVRLKMDDMNSDPPRLR
jgi:ethanolamine ammonia-lyase small subunit